jgi:hypothetical protein
VRQIMRRLQKGPDARSYGAAHIWEKRGHSF